MILMPACCAGQIVELKHEMVHSVSQHLLAAAAALRSATAATAAAVIAADSPCPMAREASGVQVPSKHKSLELVLFDAHLPQTAGLAAGLTVIVL